jgi:protein-L-isoaspartate(D-aspartate) O-methyltransferase
MRFVLEMRQAGITDARVLAALERTPRSQYAPEYLQGLAMDDIGLPLAHVQTMTKPSLVGRMLMALDVQPGETVLEIGAGSGFQAAALASLAGHVVTLERWRDLASDAGERLARAGVMNVSVHLGDGFEGWAAQAPYHRIIVNGAIEDYPRPLLDQLKPGGVLLAPLGDGEGQRLIRLRNGVREDLRALRLQPLARGVEDFTVP